MEIISILRVLRRHRFLVSLGVALTVFLVLTMSYRVSLLPPSLASKEQTSGVASARVILAARSQPAFDLQSQITDTLGTRAELLSDLLSSDDVRARIARDAGLQPSQLAILTPVWGPPTIDVALPVSATEAAGLTYEPYVLNVTSEGNIPIITLTTTGPSALGAGKVANAGVAAITGLIAGKSFGRPDIVVQRLGPARARTLVTGPKKAIAIGAGLVVFSLWCTAIVFLSWLTGRRRRQRRMRPTPQHSPST